MSFKDAYEKSLSARPEFWEKLDAVLEELPADEKEYALKLLRNNPRCGAATLSGVFRDMNFVVTREWISDWRKHYGV